MKLVLEIVMSKDIWEMSGEDCDKKGHGVVLPSLMHFKAVCDEASAPDIPCA